MSPHVCEEETVHTRLRELDKARGEQALRSVRCTQIHTCARAHTRTRAPCTRTCMYSGGYVGSQHRDLPGQLTPASTWPLPAQPRPVSHENTCGSPALSQVERTMCPGHAMLLPRPGGWFQTSRKMRVRAAPGLACSLPEPLQLLRPLLPPSPCSCPPTPCALCRSSLLPKHQLLPHP